MSEHVLEKMSDTELEALVATHKGEAQVTNDAIAAAQGVLNARKHAVQEALNLANFVDLLRWKISEAMATPKSERPDRIEFKSGYGSAEYLRESDGMRRIIEAIEDKFVVRLDIEHVPGKGQGYWEDDPYAKVVVYLNQHAGHRRDSEEWKAAVERELERIATF